MIPDDEKFGSIEPITGSIDHIISKSREVDVDYIYGDKQAVHEIMTEFSCTEEQAQLIFEDAKTQMIQHCLDELIKEGKVIQSGVNSEGEPLYKNVEKIKKKKSKKK